jgi:RNA polymerase sigma-70 factor (ECF subfamily)
MDGESALHSDDSSVLPDAERLFDDLYRAHYREMYAYCLRRIPRERVEDAVSEIFTVAWRRIDDVPRGSERLLWLYGVARRIVAHEWRSAGRRRRLIGRVRDTAAEHATDEPELQLVERAEYRMIRKAASQLRREEQEVLLLTVWEEMPQADVAALLGISIGAVKQRLYRARRKLARIYSILDTDHTVRPPAVQAKEVDGES